MFQVKYLCCGRIVPDNVSPMANVATCPMCWAKIQWQAAADEAEAIEELQAKISALPWPFNVFMRWYAKRNGVKV
jgi:hypothetical protein